MNITEPQNTAAIVERAQMLFDLGSPADAAAELRPLLDSSGAAEGTAMIRELAARACYHSAQLHRAEEHLRVLIEMEPTSAYAHLMLGRTLQRQSRPGDAQRYLKLAAALNPDYDLA